MFLKTSISTTKKFFQKTLDNVKYLFSGGYQKIPKSPPCCAGRGANTNASCQRHRELDKKKKKKKKKKIMIMSPPVKENEGKKNDLKRKDDAEIIIMYEGKKKYDQDSTREERSYLVAQKLKELKMLENYYEDEQHALDIEQVLYYYSRLTSPPYVEIVDNFFMEMYSQLFNNS